MKCAEWVSKRLTCAFRSVNLETFNILRRLPDLSISPDTRFTYLQAPVQFEDAIGRTFPIPLEFSWEVSTCQEKFHPMVENDG